MEMIRNMNYSAQLYRLMEEELGDVGRHVLEKQCKDLNINPDNIEGKNLPRLSRILSGIMSRFGADKAKRLSTAINALRAAELEEEVEETQDLICPRCRNPELPHAETCSRCGAQLEEEEAAPKLFSEGAYSDEKSRTDLAVTDISARLTKRKET